MPINPYGVLVGRVVDSRREGAPDDTPHYQVHIRDDQGTSYRIAVNVKSKESPSELLYLVDDEFSHMLTRSLGSLGSGWHALASNPDGGGLDYIRGNLFERTAMRLLPPDVEGPDNDLADIFDHYVGRAIADPAARMFAFGERFGPEPEEADKIFGFRPGNGVHNIHMNQGNSREFRRDDGVWQDGGLLVHFPGQDRWVAVFLAFQSQAWHTDDNTGHALLDPGTGTPVETEAVLRIVAALINSLGPAPERETVTLINTSPQAVDTQGWRIVDRLGATCPLPAGNLPAGTTLVVEMTNGVALGNRGGMITLLNAEGLKVHGVDYTANQVGREGWTVVF